MSDFAPFTGFGNDTNSSVKFGILFDGNTLPNWTGGPRISQWAVANSDRTITQVNGRDPWTITLSLEFERVADLELLDGLQGQRATLRYIAGITKTVGGTVETLQGTRYLTLPDTLLLGITNDVIEVDGTCTCDATFQRSASTDTYIGFANTGVD